MGKKHGDFCWLVVFSIKREKTKDWLMDPHLKKGTCTQRGELTETIPKENCYASFREGNCSINWIMNDSWSERDWDFFQDTLAKSAETPAGRRKICDTGQAFLVGTVSPKKNKHLVICSHISSSGEFENTRVSRDDSLWTPFAHMEMWATTLWNEVAFELWGVTIRK